MPYTPTGGFYNRKPKVRRNPIGYVPEDRIGRADGGPVTKEDRDRWARQVRNNREFNLWLDRNKGSLPRGTTMGTARAMFDARNSRPSRPSRLALSDLTSKGRFIHGPRPVRQSSRRMGRYAVLVCFDGPNAEQVATYAVNRWRNQINMGNVTIVSPQQLCESADEASDRKGTKVCCLALHDCVKHPLNPQG
jgi:hypothetical protein